MYRHTGLDIAKVAAAYVGTVIGAGFASGQELLQFFASYGHWGLLGVLVTGYGFARLGTYILDLGFRLGATGYQQILYHVCGKKIGIFLDWCTALFLFGGLSIMLAGTGAVIRDFFAFPYQGGLGAMACLLLATTVPGISSIAIANLLAVPLLLATTLGIGLYSLCYHGFTASLADLCQAPKMPFSWKWLASSFLYLSYNIVLATAVLAPLGAATPIKKIRRAGGWTGGFILTLLAFWITGLILIHLNQLTGSEVPMLALSYNQHPWSHYLYAVSLLLAMYTTAIASLYGAAQKLSGTTGLSRTKSIALITVIASIVSQFGFAKLIGILYPFFGALALWFTVRLIWLSHREKR